jgi:hypothetical protein
MSTTPSPRLRLLVAGFAALVLSAALGGGLALAGGQVFTDVSSTHPFVDEIEAIGGAGISTGFPDGTYRPGEPVSRGAMAAFMGRGFGRLAFADPEGSVSASGASFVELASATMTAGATGSGGGLVLVLGKTDVFLTPSTSCPCRVQTRMRVDGELLGDGTQTDLNGVAVGDGNVSESMTVLASYEIGADADAVFTLEARVNDAQNPPVTFDGTLALLYVPFTGTGDAVPS